jgi:hypothetical protein
MGWIVVFVIVGLLYWAWWVGQNVDAGSYYDYNRREADMGKGRKKNKAVTQSYGYTYWRKPPERLPALEHIEPAMSAVEMFRYARPEGSGAQLSFIEHYLYPLGVEIDGMGNCIKRIGDAPVLWSCHTDTVAHKSGRQDVQIDNDFISLDKSHRKWGNCLGGDDTCGVWIMREMIKREIPGLYIFHRGEEVGCKGSRYIAKETPELLEGIKFAIAFDRRDYHSIITKQCGKRCCSNEFAESLAKQLGYTYRVDPTGLYTDTAQYIDLIGECTNLSVGYFYSHSDDELVDLRFLNAVLEKACALDIGALVEKRKAGESETYEIGQPYYRTPVATQQQKQLPGFVIRDNNNGSIDRSPWKRREETKPRGFLSEDPAARDQPFDPSDERRAEEAELEGLCNEFPELAADLLEHLGIDAGAFMRHIIKVYGDSATRRK